MLSRKIRKEVQRAKTHKEWLIPFLLAAGRTEDAQKAVESEGARKDFYDEFGIE